jgi:fibronectin-binding autotransporter adhesin
MSKDQPIRYENSQIDSSLESSSLEASSSAVSQSAELGSSKVQKLNLLKFNRRALIITSSALGLIAVIAVAAIVFGGSSKNNANHQVAANYTVGAVAVKPVPAEQALEVGKADHLAINGQLRVTNTVVIAPTTTPTDASKGQIYYDQNTNQPYYYDGTQFVSLAPVAAPVHVTSIGGATGVVRVGTGLQLVDGQLQLGPSALAAIAGSGVTSFQGKKGDVSLTGGSGITINGTNIINSGVINLTSAAAAVSITNNGSGGYTLSGNVIGGTGSAGQIALFTGGSTVSGSILSQSGSVVTAAGNLTVSGAVSTNSLQQTAAGNNVSISAGSDNIIFTAGGRTFSLPTNGIAVQTICTSGASCASGSGVAVVLNPGSPQPDTGAGSSIAVNNTGGGNLLQLQSNGSDKFVVNNSGVITVGTIDYSQVLNRPTSVVTSLTGTANQVIVSSSTGNVTLSLPQSLAVASSPSFASLGLSGTLTVTGSSTFNGAVNISGNNTLTVGTGTTTLGGTLNVSGVTTLGGTLSVTGSTTFNSNISQVGAGSFSTGNGAVTLNGNTSVAGTNTFTTGSGAVTLGSLGAGLVQSNGSGLLSSGAVDRNNAADFSSTLSVANGGTGTTAFANNGLLYGNNAGAVQATAAGANGQLLLANALGVPTFTSLGGDASLTGAGALTINKLQGTGLTLSSLATGQVVQYNGTNFVNGLISNTNLQPGSFGNITGTGALTSGSIGAGFGAISTGNNVTTTAAIQGATVTATGGLQGNSLSVSGFAVSNTGAITAVTGITTTGGYTQTGASTNSFSGATTFTANLSQTGAGSFSTGTGAVSLNGNTSVTGTNTFGVGTGGITDAGALNVSGASTLSGSTNVGGALGVNGAATFTSNVAVQGGNVTIGTTGVNGLLNLTNSTNSNLTALQALAPTGAGTATIQIPSIAGGSSDQLCLLSLGNCAGAGAGVTHGTSSAGYVPVFSSGNNITNSILFQSGTTVGINTTTPGAYALNVQGGDVNFAGATTVGNGLNVTGASSLNGAVSVSGANTFTVGTGATSLGGTLNVTGATTLGTLTAGASSLGATTIGSTLGVTGATTLTSLSASGAASFTGTISQTGAVSFSTGTGAVSLNGDTTIASGKNFSQTGAGTFGTGTGNVSLNGNTTVTGTSGFTVGSGGITDNGALTASGPTNLNGATTVTGTANINTTGTGATAIGNATATVSIASTGLNVTTAGATSGITTLAVSGIISGATSGNTINGLIINSGALSGVTGISTSGGYSQTGAGANTFSGAATFGAAGTALTVNNNATITGTASIGTLSVAAGGITDSGNLTVSGTGTSTVAGQLNLTAASIGLNVTNNATIGGTLAIQGANGLTVGTAGSVTGSLALANTTNTNLGVLQAAAATGVGNATYVLPSIAGGTTDTVCLLNKGNCGASPSTVTTSSAGTTNQLAKFTGANTIANSGISDDGTTISLSEALSATTISATTIQSSGALAINPGGNLTIGATNRITAIQGNASSTFTVSASGFTTTLGFVAPSTANNTITFPAATGTVCLQNSASCGFATSGSGVTSLDGLGGALTIGNTSGAGSAITIDNASTTQKGIAQFNASDFTASAGVIDTVQGITTASAVQFGSLTLAAGGNLTLSSTGKVFTNNVTNVGASDITFDATTNAFVFKTNSGTNSFVFPTSGGLGQVICSSGITCATGGGQAVVLEPSGVQSANANRTAIFINKASGTGNTLQLQAGGTDALVIDNAGNTTISNLTTITNLRTNSITPTAALTVGATTQAFTLQGTGSSVISATGSGFTTNIGFNIGSAGTAPTGNVNYRFQNDNSVTPGTYNVCTTAGNCVGTGGSVTASGGVAGQLAKFSAAGNITSSIVNETGSIISVGGNLAVGTAGSASITLGVASSTSGTLVFKNGTNANTISLVPSAPSANTTVTLPNASGTVAVSAAGPIVLDALTGQITCPTCLASGGGAGGGVSSIIGGSGGSTAINGALTLNNAVTTGTTIVIDNASTTTKGIASFNATNFSASAGAINTAQDINTSANPTFGNLTLQGTTGLSIGTTSNIGQLAFKDGTADGFNVAFSPSTLTANRSIVIPNNSGTVVVAASGNLSESATGVVSTVNNPNFSTSVTTPSLLSSGALSITSAGQLNIGVSSQQLSLIGSTSSTIAVTSGANTTTVGFTAPTAARSITFPDATGTVCLQSSASCGFALSSNVVTSLNGLQGVLSVANATASAGVITINDATTAAKGIASFNATNFSIAAGAVNTIQNIATTSTPSFAGLTVGATGLTDNGTATFNGNTAVTGTNTFSVSTGATSLGGSLTTTGATSLNGGASVTGTTTINTTGTATTAIGNATGTFQLTSNALTVSTAGAIGGATTLTLSGVISGATSGNTINGLVINAGALSAITGYTQSSGNFSQGGAGTFDTASGQVNLNGNTAVTGTKTFNVGTGATTLGGALNVAGTGSFSSQLNAGSSNQFQVNSSGNVTSGTINGQTISSAANFTGSVAVQGAAGLTLGVGSTTAGLLSFANATSGRTVSLQANNPSFAGNVALNLPTIAVAADEVCLKTTANCTGTGGGVSGTGYSANYVTKFTATNNQITASQLFDNGSFVGVNTTTANGQLSVVASGTQSATYAVGAASGAAAVSIIKSGGSTGDLLDFQPTGSTVPIAKVDVNGSATFVDLNLTGNFAQTGTGTVSTGTGTVSLNGNTAVANGKNFSTGATGSVTLGSIGTGLVQSTGGVLSGGAVDRNSGSFFNTTLTVANGGTGISSLTTNSILYATGTGTFGQLTGTAGQLLLSNASGVPTFTSLGGDATLNASGALTVSKLQGNTLTITSPASGQYLRYNGSAFVNAALGAADITGTLFSLAGSTGTTQTVTSGATVSILKGASNNLTSVASATNTITLDIVSNPTFTGSVTTQGAGGETIGVAGTTQGKLNLATTGAGTVTLQSAAQTGALALNIPVDASGTDTICLLTIANCASAGGGVTTSTGSANYVARFTGAQTIGIGALYDNGTNVGVNNISSANRLGINSLVTAAAGAQVAVATGAAANVGLLVQGFGTNSTPNQTADLAQFQSSTGAVLAKIDAGGNISTTANVLAANVLASGTVEAAQFADAAGTGSSLVLSSGVNGGATFLTHGAAAVPLAVKGFASQTADLQQFQNSSANVLSKFTANGQLVLGGLSSGSQAGQLGLTDGTNNGFAGTIQLLGTIGANQTYSLPTTGGTICTVATCTGASSGSGNGSYIQNGTALQTTANFNIQAVNNGVIGTVGGVIRGAAGGQTADLLQLQNSTGVVLASVSASGNITAGAGVFAANSGSQLTVVGQGGNNAFNVSGTSAPVGFFLNGLNVGGSVAFVPGLSTLNVRPSATNYVGQTIIGLASQTADLLQFQNSSNAVLNKVDANGGLTIAANTNILASSAINGTAATSGLAATGQKGGNTTAAGFTAGAGAGLSLTSGAGGDAIAGSANGAGGNLTLQGGAPGAGAGTAGTFGNINLQSSGGNVGISSVTPNSKLDIGGSAPSNGQYLGILGTTNLTSVTGFNAISGNANLTNGGTNGARGGYLGLAVSDTGAVNYTGPSLYGSASELYVGLQYNTGAATSTAFSGTVNNAVGSNNSVINSSSAAGIIQNATGATANVTNSGASSIIRNAVGLNINGAQATGADAGQAHNAYGLFIQNSISAAGGLTNNAYSIYNASTANSYFAGNLGIGSQTPGARLQVNSLTATNVGQIVQGVSGQSADLLQFQNSGGTVLSSITNTGNLSLPIDGSQITFTAAGNNGKIQSTGGALAITNNAGVSGADNVVIQGSQAGGQLSLRSDVTRISNGTNTTEYGRFNSAGLTLSGVLTSVGHVNNGFTLNGTLALTDFATGGSIGTAATTVDIYTAINIAQTTAGQTLTPPNPTSATAGRLLYISNTGSASFTLLGSPLKAAATATLFWNGTTWTFSGTDGASILNQSSATQSANFNIQSNIAGGVATTAATALLKVAATQTGDLLQLQNSSSQVLSKFNANGDLQVGGTSSSASSTALQVQDTSGAAAFSVNTTSDQTTLRGNSAGDRAIIGAELLNQAPPTNNFNNATYFTVTGTGATPSATQVSFTGAGAGTVTTTSSNLTVVAGKTYQVSFTTNGNGSTSDSVTPSIGGVAGNPIAGNAGSGNTQLITTTTTGQLTFNITAGFNGTLSNVSVKLVTTANATLSVLNSSGTASLEVRNTVSASLNTFIGVQAGQSTTTGTNSTALGVQALQFNTTGFDNTAVGTQALSTNTTGYHNTAIGFQTLQANSTGNYNTAIGTLVLQSNTTGTGNTAVGSQALQSNSVGSSNVAFGNLTLQANTYGSGNTALGQNALQSNTTGNSNNALGQNALQSNTTGSNNLAIGLNSLSANTISNNNIGIGTNSLASTTGGNNTAIGTGSLGVNTTGTSNLALGYNAGNQDADVFRTVATLQNASAIGANSQVQSNNNLILGSVGSSGTTKVGIGTTQALNLLSVESIDYTAGTVSQSGTTITGVGTAFTAAMVGDQITFADTTSVAYTAETITAFTDATHLTASASQTISSAFNYRLHTPGLQVTTAGTVGVGTFSPNAQLQVNSRATGTVAQIIQGAAGQTADLLQIQNTSGSTLIKVDNNGGLSVNANTNVLASSATNGTTATAGLNVTGQKGGNNTASGFTAGAGAALNLTGGAGGDAVAGSTNGTGGALTIQGGAPGTGAGTAAAYGNISLQTAGGNVGVGTAAPAYKLDVSGALRLQPSAAPAVALGVTYFDSTANKFKCSEDGSTFVNCIASGGAGTTLQGAYTASTGGTTPEIKLDSTRGALNIQDANTTLGATADLFAVHGSNAGGLGSTLFNIQGSGNVGIGTTTPGSLVPANIVLEVNRTQSASSVIAATNTSTGIDASSGFVAYNQANSSSVAYFGLAGTGYTTTPILQNRAFVIAGSNLSGIAINTTTAQPIVFGTSNTEIARFSASGNLTIGSALTGSKLTVVEQSGASVLRGITSLQNSNDIAGAIFGLYKSRGTNAAPLAVQSGDFGGSISNAVYDGSAYLVTGSAGFAVSGPVAANSIPTDYFIATGNTNDTNATNKRLVVTSLGNVGIGTLAPAEKLDVAGNISVNYNAVKLNGRKPRAVLLSATGPAWNYLVNQSLVTGTVDTTSSAATLAAQDYDIYIVDVAFTSADSYNSKLFSLWKTYGKNVISIGNDTQNLYPITGTTVSVANRSENARPNAPHVTTQDLSGVTDIGTNTDTSIQITSLRTGFSSLYVDNNAPNNTLGAIGESETGGIWFHDQSGFLNIASQASTQTMIKNIIAYMTGSDSRFVGARVSNSGVRNISNLLYADQATGTLGIGTTTPQQALTLGATSNLGINLATPAVPTLVANTTGGALTVGTYYYVITALDGSGGQTAQSQEASVLVAGATASVTVNWASVPGATGYRIYRGTSAGGENTYYTSTSNSFNDTGAGGTGGTPPTVTTAYGVKLSANSSSYIAGNLGIGTGAPSYKLDINGAFRLQPSTAPAAALGVSYFDSTANKFKCSEDGSTFVNCIGTGAGTIGALNGGTANANGATITGGSFFLQSASTSFAGLVDTTTQSFAGNKTFTGNITTSGLTNNSFTLNGTLALTDFAAGGSIGTAATTVDIYTAINIAQTTAGQTVTLPNPTSTTAGRILYISNTGSASFTLLGSPLKPTATATLFWNGTTWTFSGTDGASILNQSASVQTGNFNIQSSASGSIGGIIRGAVGGQTVDLLQIQNTSGIALIKVDNNGGVTINANTNILTPSATNGTAATAGFKATGQKGGNNTAAGFTAGAGAGLNLTGGAGGDAVAGSTNGAGGDITLQGGAAGAGAGAAGATGRVVIPNANGLVLGTSSSATGGLVFKGSGGAGSLTLAGPTTPNAANYTLTLPAITSNDTVCVVAANNCGTNSVNNQKPSAGVGTVQSANFYIQSADTATNVTAAITQATGQTGDLLQFQNVSGTATSGITATGNLYFNTASPTISNTLTNGGLSFNTNGSGSLALLGGNTAGAVTISAGANAGTAGGIVLGNTTGANTQSISIGTNATAGSTTNTTIGSTVAGTTTLQSATTTQSIGSTGVLVKTGTNQTTAFQVQNTGSAAVLTADTVNNIVSVGSAPATYVSLVGAGTLAAKTDNTTGTSPYLVTTGDFNNDGKLDMAVTNSGSNTVSVFIGTGTGTFAAKVDYATGTTPNGITIGDFNGDGILDLAVANSGSNTVSVFIGTGTGTFAAKVDYATATQPNTLIANDFNGDGKLDLAVTNNGSNSISIFMNNGNGTFATKVDYTTGASPAGITSGDFNGDGFADLAVTNIGTTTESVFINTGTGTFAAKVDYTTGASPAGITSGDFNGDGILDLANANSGSNTVSVFIGTGTGTFAAKVDYATATQPRDIKTADLNSDGRLDIIVSNQSSTSVSVLNGTGTGTFAAKVDYTTGTTPYGISIGDFNGDGTADVAVANNGTTTVSVLLTNTTSPTTKGTLSVLAASTSTAGLVVQGLSGQVASLVNIQNSAASTVVGVSNTGAAKFRNSVNSITAFAVQNSAGTTLFNVDTANQIIRIGTATNGVAFGSTGTSSFEPILAGTAQHSKAVILTAEYPGAVLDTASDTTGTINCSTSNTGTLTSGFDSAATFNYYQWTSNQATEQCYDIVVRVPIPSDFAAWNSTTPFSVQLNGSSTTLAHYAFQVLNTSNTAETSTTYGSQGTFGATGWASVSPVTLSSTTTGYTAGGVMTLKIRVQAKSNATVQVGSITLNYKSKF